MRYYNITIFGVFLILLSFWLLGVVVQGVAAQNGDSVSQERVAVCAELPSQRDVDRCYADLCSGGADAVCAEAIMRTIAPLDAGFAMEALVQFSRSPLFSLEQSEPSLARTIGEISFHSADTDRLGDFFLSCTPEFYHECYFGFFEAVVADHNLAPADAMASVCNTVSEPALPEECYQLTGRMIMRYTDYFLDAALSICNTLDSSFQTACYEGVFIENNTSLSLPDRILSDGFYDDDPLAPCNVIGEQYQAVCYKHHGLYLLHFFSDGSSAPAAACANAGIHEAVCRQSVSDAYLAVGIDEQAITDIQHSTLTVRPWWQRVIDFVVGLFF